MTQTRRSGLTMPEILVTITVIGILAAAVVPAVAQYVNVASAPRSQQDLHQMQTGVSRFTTDVRHYPGDLQQLVSPVLSTNGQGDSLDFDGAATPVRFTGLEASRWKGPYMSVAISTGAKDGGRYTSKEPAFTIGRKITLADGWLVVPILNPTTCAEILALNKSIDNTSVGANSEATDGVVTWRGTCDGANTGGTVTNAALRLAPAN